VCLCESVCVCLCESVCTGLTYIINYIRIVSDGMEEEMRRRRRDGMSVTAAYMCS